MASRRYRDRKKVEQQLVQLELADGWTKITCRMILTLLATASTTTSIICSVQDRSWPIPTSLAAFEHPVWHSVHKRPPLGRPPLRASLDLARHPEYVPPATRNGLVRTTTSNPEKTGMAGRLSKHASAWHRIRELHGVRFHRGP